jgi:hypothetical protein
VTVVVTVGPVDNPEKGTYEMILTQSVSFLCVPRHAGQLVPLGSWYLIFIIMQLIVTEKN